MHISFAAGMWDPASFDQITSQRTDGRKPFMQKEDCIVSDSPRETDNCMEYNYISLLHKQPLSPRENAPVRLETVCSYHRFGAPLLVLTDDVVTLPDGFPAYGHHFEIVAFEEGFNIWELNGGEEPLLVGSGRFPMPEAGQRITLGAQIFPDKFTVTLCGAVRTVPVHRVPRVFRAGVTACEGVNRFYSFDAEPPARG